VELRFGSKWESILNRSGGVPSFFTFHQVVSTHLPIPTDVPLKYGEQSENGCLVLPHSVEASNVLSEDVFSFC